ncbi:MAG TPA: penicillin-binding protein 1C [Bacteroidales bacterium]|nr:penicillin-binding protein 1C [Bacteroidales bacterium]
MIFRNWSYKKGFILSLIVVIIYLITVPRCRFSDPLSTVIYDRNGILLGARVAKDGQWRFPAADSVPEKIQKATLAFEDRYFYYHPGINPVSLFHALIANIRARHVVRGGSTLTMQVIRIYRNGKARTVKEKLIEMIMATRLELGRSKSGILQLYTSYAPYGGNVVGMEAAAWRYFGTSGADLTWAQAATLAVLPNSPSLVNPGKNRLVLKSKRDRLLNRLYKLKWIDSGTLQSSLAEDIPEKPLAMPSSAPHLLNRVYSLTPGSLANTTISEKLQQQVTDIVQIHHRQLQYNEIHNAAAIVIEVETGEILAYVGNCDYPFEKGHSNDVDIITSARSTGSLLKPLLFAAMIDDGKLLPQSLVSDIPINLGGFSPQNFDGQFEGAVTASRALSRSLNVPAVEMLKTFGVERFHHLLRKLGMRTIKKPADYYGLSLILGGAEGTLEEMANIYASLSRVLNHYGETGKYYAGDFHPASYIKNEVYTKQDALAEPEIFNSSSIWCAYQAMIEVNRPEAETGWQYFNSSKKIAWKTGTSFGYRDGWAIGTSTKYVVGVWMGNADGEGRPGLTGIAAAAPVMFDIFGLLQDAPWFKAPLDEMVPGIVCRQSGYLAGPNCPDPDTVKIPVTGIRSAVCPYHRLVHLTNDFQFQVSSNCYPVDSMKHTGWFVLPPVEEWYFKKHHADYKRLPSFKPGCEMAGQRTMDLIYPRETVKIFIPRGLKGEKGRVVFEAVHTDPDAVIYWHLDDQFIRETKYIHQVELLPAPGKHRLVLVDSKGQELVRKFEVVEP